MNSVMWEKKREIRADSIVFAVYLAGFLAVLITLAALQPMENLPPRYPNPPDEHARFLVPKFICKHGYLPTGFEDEVRVPGGLDGSYAFQPMLPYIIMGYLMRLFARFSVSADALLYVARAVNVVSGTIMAVTVFFLGKRLFQKPVWRYVFCFGIMYLPQHLFLHSYVNTESMCMLSIALLLYALVSLYQDGPGIRNHVYLAVGATLLIQTYYNAYGYLVAGVWLYAMYYAEQEKGGRFHFRWKPFLKNALPVVAFVILGSGWWFVREAILLNGDFTGIRTNNEVRTGVISPAAQGIGLLELFRTRPAVSGLVRSAIARYGSMSINASDRYYRVYEYYLGTGLLLSLAGLRKRKEASRIRIRFHAAMLTAVLITILLWVYYVYRIDYQLQGRYILPALIPLYYYICKGYENAASHVKNSRAETLIGTMPVLFVVAALYHYILKLCIPYYLMS